jgi:hypothetical protein
MGTVSFTVSPATATTYSAVLEAGPDYPSSTSQDVTVTVVPRSMPFAASQHAVAYGGKAKLTLTGVATSGKVDLFATPNGQSRVLLNTATVPEGQHTVTFTVAPERTTAYVAEREDRSAASNNVAVSVHPLLVFAVHAKRVSPQMVRRHGEKVVLGAVRSPPLPGEPLKIEIDKARAHGGWKMVARGEIPVGATGVVIGVLTVKLTGKYRAQMSFAGDGDYTSVRSAWRRFRVG